MSDFTRNSGKRIAANYKKMLHEQYSNTVGFQFTLNKFDYSDGTSSEWTAKIEMAEGSKERNASGSGYHTKCDWTNKVAITLSNDELAKIAKYMNPLFAKRIGTPIPDYDADGKPITKNGSPVFKIDKSGKPCLYGETFFHMFNGVSAILHLNKNNMDPLGGGVSITKEKVTRIIYMSESDLFKFAMACKFALDFIWRETMTVWKPTGGNGYGGSGYNNNNRSSDNGYGGSNGYSNSRSRNYGNSSYGNEQMEKEQPKSFRDTMKEDEFKGLPISTDDFLSDDSVMDNI